MGAVLVATILALSVVPSARGWYLMAPPWRLERPGAPQPDAARPLREWTIESSHPSVKDCDDTRRQHLIDALRTVRDTKASREPLPLAYARVEALAADHAACVSTDDPRLH
jgi:hypothetical protein